MRIIESAGWWFKGRSRRGAILADVVVDTTGDGEVFALVGNDFELQKVVPWLWFRLGNSGEEAVNVSGPLKVFRTVHPGEGPVVPWCAVFALTRGFDVTNVEDLTWVEVACRKKNYEVIKTRLEQLPDLEHAHMSHVATQWTSRAVGASSATTTQHSLCRCNWVYRQLE